MTNDLIESIEREIFNRSSGNFFSKNDEIKFLCPAHKDTKPSAHWNQQKKFWYCDAFGTGAGCIDLANRFGLNI